MTEPSFFERHLAQPLDAFVQLPGDQRGGAIRAAVPDLHFFLDEGRGFEQRDAPERSRSLARSLHDALIAEAAPGPALRERIVTDAFLRSEADRDQNVYLGGLFTRRLTRATPDLLFQPATLGEAARALRWAREQNVPLVFRGAASTAMGGAVPGDGGLALDLSRLDSIEVDAKSQACVVGAGARLRAVHAKLAAQGLALRVYPSNLGGTLAGWFVTGGIGMNAYGRGRALDSVRAADVLLPSGDHLRFHDDGRLDVPDANAKRRTLAAAEAESWFRERGLEPIGLADLAGSEGVLGLVLHLTVSVEPRPEIGAFLLSFAHEADAFAAVSWVTREAGGAFPHPANVKLLSGTHLHHTRRVWADEDSRDGRGGQGGEGMPWARIVGPRSLGAGTGPDREDAEAYLFVDFLGLEGATRFANALPSCPGAPVVLDAESVRFASERFRPQQTKRLGPGLLAAEILMPASEVPRFLPAARALAKNVRNAIDAEAYYLADGVALVIAGYLTDHRKNAYLVDLMLAPALTDLAMRHHQGRPYVLGRWMAAFAERKLGAERLARLAAINRALDPPRVVNRGVLLGFELKGALGRFLARTFVPGVGLLRAFYASPVLSWFVREAREWLDTCPGPAFGRGEPAAVGARFRALPPEQGERHAELNGSGAADRVPSGDGAPPLSPAAALAAAQARAAAAPGAPAAPSQTPEDRALHCVNCGECNSVCPIFHESKIRLPQMLTHLGESWRGGDAMPNTGSVLLDLCMRCGNCEEVCQAGIPHLPLYQALQAASDRQRPRDRERHTAIVAAVRGSNGYLRDFLHVRPGGYLKRSPASLPGMARYVVLRAENDAGPASTCIHCGACVSVCPTHANREFEGIDPRWITTEQERCIGCGTCVEVCPANEANGGRTLRVVEAPAREWHVALEEFERMDRA